MERRALYLIPAPIGNRSDLTLRALDILRSVDAIAAEDLRAATALLEHHAIATPLIEAARVTDLCDRMDAGHSIALLSGPHPPLYSDPESALVKQAIRRGLPLVPLPGANPLATAVNASGLPADQLLFLGFLPEGDTERRALLAPLRAMPYTLVVYEKMHRISDTLRALHESLGDRRAVVARDLTTDIERFVRDRLASLAGAFGDPAEGDAVIVVGPAETAPEQALEDLLLEKLRAYVASLQGLAPENMYGLIMPQLERPLIRVALEISGGRQVQAAEMLGIHRNTLRMKLRALGMDDKHPLKEEP